MERHVSTVEIVTELTRMRDISQNWRAHNAQIGFVPTMGYLHEGHLSLLRQANHENDHCVVSIFVNPTQFSPQEDLDVYPRDLEGDHAKIKETGAEVIFYPTDKVMYPPGYKTYVTVTELSSKLCGITRPTHFRGVTTIVCKLFNIVGPHRAYFGQKDAQQAFIIKKMVTDLDMDVVIRILPIIREEDGLAMSSRNAYLSPTERRAATVLHRALQNGLELFQQGSREPLLLQKALQEFISQEPLARIDYVSIVDPDTFLEPGENCQTLLAAVAVFFGQTRLIDNMTYSCDE
ncbi:pantoate--beta-alanine ligase [candidate division CSSED10-310 bacterium]|uniref:Pantothenate synthetase n=1 Tax=candidate division CSSED10-310 bacterium TaxID=2855610 RepID=A0ABV6Z2C4_UNCC1